MRCAHAHLKMFSKETCFFILSDIVYVTLLHKFLRENEPASFLIKQLIRTNKFIGFHFFFSVNEGFKFETSANIGGVKLSACCHLQWDLSL